MFCFRSSQSLAHRVTYKATLNFGLNSRQQRNLNVIKGDVEKLPLGVKVSFAIKVGSLSIALLVQNTIKFSGYYADLILI